METYYLLDSQELLRPVQIVSMEILKKKLNCSAKQVKKNIFQNKLIDDRYIVVENEEESDTGADMRLFEESSRNCWYACNDGNIYVVNKFSHVQTVLPKHIDSKNGLYVYIQKKRRNVKKNIAETFCKTYREGDFIQQIDTSDPWNTAPSNLKIIPRRVYFKQLQSDRVCQPIGQFIQGQCVRSWSSVSSAAKDLFLDRSTLLRRMKNGTISDYGLDLRFLSKHIKRGDETPLTASR